MSKPATDAKPSASRPSVSDAALAAHARRMRRPRLLYVAALALIVVGGAVLVGFVWVRGEVHNTVLHTTTKPAAALPLTAPAATLAEAWSTADRVAVGAPAWNGTVVTYGQHVLRGRDARSGAITWSYRRSNRTTCAAAQSNGTAVVIFRVNGNCDEVTGLDSATGVRRWTRTLDMDGHPVNGTPVVTATPYTVLVRTSTVLYAIAPDSGYDRWQYHPDSCTIHGAVVGDAGALISQTCHDQDCGSIARGLCGDGAQLLLRDAYCGYQDTSKTCRDKDSNNPNQIIWNNFGDSDVPVSASVVISALNRTTLALDLFASTDGKGTANTPLDPAPASPADVQAALTNGGVLVNAGGTVHFVSSTGQVSWSSAATGPVTVTAAQESEWPARVEDARVTVPSSDMLLTLDARTGVVQARSALPSTPPAGSTAVPLGSGFIVYGDDGGVVYR